MIILSLLVTLIVNIGKRVFH
ncbi:MAG: hypothetical protein ABI675_10310 [Chitinophagaceae bacterium]